MVWEVIFHPDFRDEFRLLPLLVRRELTTATIFLAKNGGPRLGRPLVDTLSGSGHSNMKELRFEADGGVWRVAFAFDPKRNAIILVAGNKSGTNEKRFYRELIDLADERFLAHLNDLKHEGSLR